MVIAERPLDVHGRGEVLDHRPEPLLGLAQGGLDHAEALVGDVFGHRRGPDRRGRPKRRELTDLLETVHLAEHVTDPPPLPLPRDHPGVDELGDDAVGRSLGEPRP